MLRQLVKRRILKNWIVCFLSLLMALSIIGPMPVMASNGGVEAGADLTEAIANAVTWYQTNHSSSDSRADLEASLAVADVKAAQEEVNAPPATQTASMDDLVLNEESNITVYFKLIGDSKHGTEEHIAYQNWIPATSVIVPQGSKVYDVFHKVLSENGMEYDETMNNYIGGIKAPASFGGHWLYEKDNGPMSGWKYLVNGQYPNFGLREYQLEDGDAIVWHYTDDFTESVCVDVAYSATGDITEISFNLDGWAGWGAKPEVTFADDKFSVSLEITEFTFKDGDQEMKTTFAFADDAWTFELIPISATTVTFTVTDGENAAIAGASITIGGQILTTDANGKATIDLEDGTYAYSVTADGYDAITDGEVVVSGAAVAEALTMTATVAEPDTCTVTFNVTGANGTLTATVDDVAIKSGDAVQAGKTVVFTATPADGYQVKGWTLDGEAVADNTTNTLTVENLATDTIVTVEFEAIPTKAQTIQTILITIADSFKGKSGDWTVMDMAAYGLGSEMEQAGLIANALNVYNNTKSSATDYERVAISLTSMGIDATAVDNGEAGTADFIEKIANYNADKATPSLVTINAYIYALLAYDSGAYELPDSAYWTREKIKNHLLAQQLADGGWALGGTKADPDVTGMAISALANYWDDAAVAAALDKAVNCLSNLQTATGGFKSWGSENSNSASMVIVALSALGIDVDTDTRFIKEGKSAIDALLNYKTNDDRLGFTDTTYNAMATEQGFRALVAYTKMLAVGEPYNIYVFAETSAPAKPQYTVTPVDDAAYIIGTNPDGISIMTVNSGVSGIKYFAVQVTPVIEHEGMESVVFTHLRNNTQFSLNATKADFDTVDAAQAGFNVLPSDIVKAYIVDELTNAEDSNPTILQ